MKGEKVELRAIEPGDISLLYEWENDKNHWYISNTVAPFSRFVLEQYIMNSHLDIYSTKQLRLMIDKISESGNKTVGAIDLFDFDPNNKRAGIGILIKKSERKKGLASDALGLLTDYCFEVLHLHQVYCNILESNLASIELFKKHKFEIVGLKKEWIHAKDSWENEYLLQRINKV